MSNTLSRGRRCGAGWLRAIHGWPVARHPVDPPVALDAADAFCDVDAVVEINEVGQVVDPVPRERRPRAKGVHEGIEHRLLREELRVAGHAGFERR